MEENKFKVWGKLGGRPKVDHRMKMQVNIRFTVDDYNKLLKKAQEKNMETSAYCRIVLSEKEIPNVEQNKTLMRYANNFSKIKNYMQMGIFNESEKKRLIDEIEVLISEMRSLIKWL